MGQKFDHLDGTLVRLMSVSFLHLIIFHLIIIGDWAGMMGEGGLKTPNMDFYSYSILTSQHFFSTFLPLIDYHADFYQN